MKIPLLPFTALILTLLLYTSCQENRFKIIEFYEEPSLPLQVLVFFDDTLLLYDQSFK